MTQDYFTRNVFIEGVMKQFGGEVARLERKHSIPEGYLRLQLLLHIVRFPANRIEEQLTLEAKRLIPILKRRLKGVPDDLYQSLFITARSTRLVRKEGLIIEMTKNVPSTNVGNVEFRQVSKSIGRIIQEKLHYVGQARDNTLYQFGLFKAGEVFPFAYCAFSFLERAYIHKALPVHAARNKVLILTRSFSINSSPENSMSLLIGKSLWFIREVLKDDYDYVVTTVNPNLLFTGNVFRGAGFLPFCTTGNNPRFFEGNYITGKQVLEGRISRRKIKNARIQLVPNVWFIVGAHKRAQKLLLKKMNV